MKKIESSSDKTDMSPVWTLPYMKSRRRRYEEKMRSKNSGFPFILAGQLAFAPQGSFLGNMQGIKAVQARKRMTGPSTGTCAAVIWKAIMEVLQRILVS